MSGEGPSEPPRRSNVGKIHAAEEALWRAAKTEQELGDEEKEEWEVELWEMPQDDEVQQVRREILRRASTDETTRFVPVRKTSSIMKPSESLDAAKHDGILKRKRSCLQKTVSFSETVSEQTLPEMPPPEKVEVPATQKPKEEGEYVEKTFHQEVYQAPKPRVLTPSASRIGSMEEITRYGTRISRASIQMDEQRMKEEQMKQSERTRMEKRGLTVEDLPKDQDPDEFGLASGGLYKCGNCTVGIAPVKKKRLWFVTLTERALEFYESEKAYKHRKTAKHMVDLSISFNVHGDHYDAKMKKCLCLMGPDETICMRPEGGIATIEGWRRALVRAIHESRRRKMDRTPIPEDIFDAVYDIRICETTKNPSKYEEDRKEHGFTNICTVCTDMAGKKRLCIYPGNLAIAELCIEPTSHGLPPAGFPPFRASNLFIIERSTVAYYGFRDNYFYIRIGKGSPFRGFEILFSVENSDVCREINKRIGQLIEKDRELRNYGNWSYRRSGEISDLHGMDALSVPSPLSYRSKYSLDSPNISAKDRRLLLARDRLSFASVERDDSAPSSPFTNYNRPRGSLGNFQVDHLSRYDQPRGSIHSLGNLPVERPRVPTFQQAVQKFVREEPGLRESLMEHQANLRKKHSTQSERGDIMLLEQERKMSDAQAVRQKITITPLTREDYEPPHHRVQPQVTRPSITRPTEGPSKTFGYGRNIQNARLESSVMSGNKAGTSDEHDEELLAMLAPGRIINSDDYTVMGPADWAKKEDLIKDNVSDSGDSCYSSVRGSVGQRPKGPTSSAHLSCQMHNRAQSFGAKAMSSSPRRIPPTVNLPDSERKISAVVGMNADRLEPEDDIRKRAFSLGSGKFSRLTSALGLPDFGRLVGKRHRTSSPQNASSSKISLNSSNPSPSSGSTNFLNSTDGLDHGRTSTFGSGRNSPALLRSGGRETPKKKSDDDLVSIDFSQLGNDKKHVISDARRYPFMAGATAAAVNDYDKERRLQDEQARRALERKAMAIKEKEEEEIKAEAEKRRAKERKAQEKKERKEREKEEKFRPKADSGIADCTPSSSFSGKNNQKKNKDDDYTYADPQGLKFLADIKKIKQEQNEQTSAVTDTTSTCSSSNSTQTIIDNRAENGDKTAEVQSSAKRVAPVDLNRKSSICADLIRKSSICAAIAEEKEGFDSETDSKGEPSKATPSRKLSTSTLTGPFKRLKFLSFRKQQ